MDNQKSRQIAEKFKHSYGFDSDMRVEAEALFRTACKEGDLDSIKVFYQKPWLIGLLFDLSNPGITGGITGLSLAANYGHLHLIEFFLDKVSKTHPYLFKSEPYFYYNQVIYQASLNKHWHIVDYILPFYTQEAYDNFCKNYPTALESKNYLDAHFFKIESDKIRKENYVLLTL